MFNVKKIKCKEHCHINTYIPMIIDLYKQDKLYEAGKILFENSPLSYICSIFCYHREQCYGNCVLNARDKAAKFYEIERKISEKYFY